MAGFARHALGFGVFRWSPAGLIFHERPSVTLSPRRGVLFSVAVEGLSLRACTLRSLFSGAAIRPPPVPRPLRSFVYSWKSVERLGGGVEELVGLGVED